MSHPHRGPPTHLFQSRALPGPTGQNSHKFQGLTFSRGRGEAWGKRRLQAHIFIKSNEAVVWSLHLGRMDILHDGSLNKQCGKKNMVDSVDSKAEYDPCQRREPGPCARRALSSLFPKYNQPTSYQSEWVCWFLFFIYSGAGDQSQALTPAR